MSTVAHRSYEGLSIIQTFVFMVVDLTSLCVQVTLIPTFDSPSMHQWYQETHGQQATLGLTVLGSNSTVAMQEDSFPACKVEF